MFSPGPVQTKGLVNLPDFLPNFPMIRCSGARTGFLVFEMKIRGDM